MAMRIAEAEAAEAVTEAEAAVEACPPLACLPACLPTTCEWLRTKGKRAKVMAGAMRVLVNEGPREGGHGRGREGKGRR